MWVILQNDSDFAGDLEDSKSTSGGTLCIFGSHTFVPISWMCKKQTSVSHSSTESEIISLDAGLRMDGRYPRLIYGIWSSQFLETRIREYGETCVRTNVKFVQNLAQFKNESNLMEWLMIWTMLILFPQTSSLLIRKLCCMCLKTTKGKKPNNETCFQNPQSCPWLVVRWNQFGPPKSNTLTPKTNSQTYWPREISHVMNGIIFCVCLTLAISVLPNVLKWCRKEADDEFWSRDIAKGFLKYLSLWHQKARGKPDLKVNYLWARGRSTNQERGDLWWALAHQVTQSGILTKSGLLLSGNLMKCWKQERRDSWVDNQSVRSLSTQTGLSLMTMMWTLTPSQNQTCR